MVLPSSSRHEITIDIGNVGPASPRLAGAPLASATHPSDQVATPAHAVEGVLRNLLDAIKRIGSAGSFEGEVSVKEGRFVSDQPQINALLGYAKLNPSNFVLNGKESLTLTLDPAIGELRETLDAALTVETVKVKPGEGTPLLAENTENAGSNLLIVHMQEMLQKGRAASNVNVASEDGGSLRIADIFASRSPSISSSNGALAEAILQKIDEDPDLKIKLAAASMLQVATTKRTSLTGLAISLLVSAGVGTLWELQAYPRLLAMMTDKLAAMDLSSGAQEALTTLGDLMLRAFPNVVIEPIDTASVLFSGDEMKGTTDTAGSANGVFAKLKEKLPDGMRAGMISAGASVPANLADLYKTHIRALDGASALGANQLAVFGAASGVPPGLKEDMEHTHAAVVSHLAGGQLALPEGKVADKDIIAHGRELAQRALAVDPGTAILTQAMAVSSIAGTLPAILGKDVLNAVGESKLRMVRSGLFQPIEAISMNSLALLSKVGVPGLMQSDPSKLAALTELVLKKADAGPQGREAPIQAAEFDAIFKPEILGRVGQHITNGINGSLAGAHSMVAKTHLINPPQRPLVDRLDIEATRREHTSPV